MTSFILFAVKKMWWLVPILTLSIVVWAQHGTITRLHGDILEQDSALAKAALELQTQNQAVLRLKTEGQAAANKAQAMQARLEQEAKKVQVRWKTEYVQVPIPGSTCSAAVAAAAVNGAQIGRLYMEGK